jgi:hypothetical protein
VKKGRKMGEKENRVPATNQGPPTARELELVRLRALERALRKQVERRIEEIRILRLETAEHK